MKITKSQFFKLIREYLEEDEIVFIANPDDTVEREIKVVAGIYYDSIGGQWDEVTDKNMIKYLESMQPDDLVSVSNDKDTVSGSDSRLNLSTAGERETPAHLKQQAPTREFLEEILHEVLAKTSLGKVTKSYTHLKELDGGTVGIAHFAAGGMINLYNAMGDGIVKKYFGKHNPVIDSVAALDTATATSRGHCKTKKSQFPAGSNSCWKAMPWWVDGMRDFLSDSGNNEIQFQGWINSTVNPANKYIDNYRSTHPSWGTARGRAIAYALTNSNQMFVRKYSKNGKLSPNDTMEAYNKLYAKRVRSRMRNINRLYPDPDFKPSFKPDAYT